MPLCHFLVNPTHKLWFLPHNSSKKILLVVLLEKSETGPDQFLPHVSWTIEQNSGSSGRRPLEVADFWPSS